jgi:arsenate reductase (thioredoxin)
MAAALLERRSGGRVRVFSAGSEPAERLHPAVVEAMDEVGIEIAGERPKRLADGMVKEADVVITMGCGDACPIYPGKRYEDWELEDPTGKGLETVRGIRDQIAARVDALVAELFPRV